MEVETYSTSIRFHEVLVLPTKGCKDVAEVLFKFAKNKAGKRSIDITDSNMDVYSEDSIVYLTFTDTCF